MDDKVNLAEKVRLLDKPYRPGIVGYLNDYKLEDAQRDRDPQLRGEGQRQVCLAPP